MKANNREAVNYASGQTEAAPTADEGRQKSASADLEGLKLGRDAEVAEWFKHARRDTDRWFWWSAIGAVTTVIGVVHSLRVLQTLPLTWDVLLPFCALRVPLAVPLLWLTWGAVQHWRMATALYAAMVHGDADTIATVIGFMTSGTRNMMFAVSTASFKPPALKPRRSTPEG